MTVVRIGPDFELGRQKNLGPKGEIAKAVRKLARAHLREHAGEYRIRVDLIPLLKEIFTDEDARTLEVAARLAVDSRWAPEVAVAFADLPDPAIDFRVDLEALARNDNKVSRSSAGATRVWQTQVSDGSERPPEWNGNGRFVLTVEEPKGKFTARFASGESLLVGRQDRDASGIPLTPMRREEDGVTVIAVPTANESLSRRAFRLSWQPNGQVPGWKVEVVGRVNGLRVGALLIEAGESRAVRCGDRFRIAGSTFFIEEE